MNQRPTIFLITLLLCLGMVWLIYILTANTITLQQDGQSTTYTTHQPTVGAWLTQQGIDLQPADIITPPPETPLTEGIVIRLQLAHPISLQVDGRTIPLFSQPTTAAQLFTAHAIPFKPHDQLWGDGQPLSFEATLPFSTDVTSMLTRPTALTLRLQRATPIYLQQGRLRQRLDTTALTVGAALAEQGFTLYPEDALYPPADTPIKPGLDISLRRAMPMTVMVDGQVINHRTLRSTVGELLAELGLNVMGQDVTEPPLHHHLSPHETVRLVRVREVVQQVDILTPFETQWQASDELELDEQVILDPGQAGRIQQRLRVRYEDEQVLWQAVEDEWLATVAQTRRVAYGTRIITRTLQTPDGPIAYWRKISVLTTAYSAATSGKASDHPTYGMTRTGKQAGYGLVAVDPRVIPLATKLYIPDYGRATADDTGGAVLGRHVDLGFDEDEPPNIYGWRTIYLLPPIPPAYQIRYILPDWPQREVGE